MKISPVHPLLKAIYRYQNWIYLTFIGLLVWHGHEDLIRWLS